MDINGYKQRKQGQKVALQKVGHQIVLTSKRFDPNTGDEIDPVVSPVIKTNLVARKQELEKMIAEITELIKDVDALEIT